MARAVSYLPERERRIVTLRYFEGKALREIAALEGVEPRTIFTRRRAALKRLAATLRPLFAAGYLKIRLHSGQARALLIGLFVGRR